jgi:hypothetical protein
MWDSHTPEESQFSITTLVDSDIDLSLVKEAAKTVSASCIVISFIMTESSYDPTLPQPLTRLMQGIPGVELQEIWTTNVSWKFFHQLFPVRTPRSWQTLTFLSLDLTIDTLEDQSRRIDVLEKGNMKRFLARLRKLRHLSLSFYSELPAYDVLYSHAPLERILDPQLVWPYLKSLRLDGFDSTAHELLSFLASTLRVLTLQNFFLLSGSWVQILPEIRESLSLEQAEVAGAVEACNELWLVSGYQNSKKIAFLRRTWPTG